jgi:transposase-like protein
MRGIEEFCCQNLDCADHGKRGAGNLRQHGWSSKKQGIRMLYCRTCKTYFSERKGTALEGSRLPIEKAISVLEHLQDNCGVRQTSRLVKVSTGTVSRLISKAGVHAQAAHDELVADSPPD